MKFVMICLGFLYGNLIFSQDVFGEWKTIDEDTGVAKSIVEIYKKDGKVYGKVKKILREDKRDMRCTKCKGDLKNQKIETMVILRGLSKDGEKYTGGKITDPEKGKTYGARIWIEEAKPNTLMVRGYVAFFYRTQKWKRVEE